MCNPSTRDTWCVEVTDDVYVIGAQGSERHDDVTELFNESSDGCRPLW
jgi:hypothetical protein